jgi:hypothetical protein
MAGVEPMTYDPSAAGRQGEEQFREVDLEGQPDAKIGRLKEWLSDCIHMGENSY